MSIQVDEHYFMAEKFRTEKTCEDLLREASGNDAVNGQYWKENMKNILSLSKSSDLCIEDLFQYWRKCLILYNEYGINYFSGVLELYDPSSGIGGHFGSFDGDIETWFADELDASYGNHDKEKFLHLVDLLRFFKIESYQKIPFSEFDHAAKEIDSVIRRAQEKREEERSKKRQAKKENDVERYFNYSDFSEPEFESQLHWVLFNRQNEKMTIGEALQITNTIPQKTYIVIFEANGKATYIGKTTRLLQYIIEKQKGLDVDHVSFAEVDDAYADDLLVDILVAFDFPLSKIFPVHGNRKYGSKEQARCAYSVIKNKRIMRRKFDEMIEKNGVACYDLEDGRVLINKLDLRKVLLSVPEL